MFVPFFKRFSCLSQPSLKRLYSTTNTTVDNLEIEHFEKLTAEWWNEYGPTKGLHSMNRLRVPFIRDSLINEGVVPKNLVNTSTPLKGLSVLDVGCGGGILSEALARLGAQVTGLDANSSLINIAKKHSEEKSLNIDYIYTSIEDHSKKNPGNYDAIAASEIIEHITEKQNFIASCSNCLKPSGSLFISTLNKTFLANFLSIYLIENVLDFVPRGTHQFEKFIEPHKLQRILEDCNLRTKLIHGMLYNIATNRWHWCSNTSINYCLHAVKC